MCGDPREAPATADGGGRLTVAGASRVRPGGAGVPGGRRGQAAGQFRNSASSASRTRVQVSWVSGALWLKPPPSSRVM